MFSVRLRHRTDPQTDAPRAIAYSAMWLPTKPVIPVMSKRTALYPTRSDGPPAPAAAFGGRPTPSGEGLAGSAAAVPSV